MKIFLMIFVTLALINDKPKLDAFIWVLVISLGFYGVKGGVFTLITGGNYRVWGPGGFVAENNALALALIMIIPLMRYLQLQQTRRWAVLSLGFAMAFTIITVLGSYSRGALLGMSVMERALGNSHCPLNSPRPPLGAGRTRSRTFRPPRAPR